MWFQHVFVRFPSSELAMRDEPNIGFRCSSAHSSIILTAGRWSWELNSTKDCNNSLAVESRHENGWRLGV